MCSPTLTDLASSKYGTASGGVFHFCCQSKSLVMWGHPPKSFLVCLYSVLGQVLLSGPSHCPLSAEAADCDEQ